METLEFDKMTAQEIIKQLDLQKHPEGGYFKEMYRSTETIPNRVLGNTFVGDRNHATSIYFLLTTDNFSAFHKINQDEIWHFYKGSCLHLHIITQQGEHQIIKIGNNLENGEVPQFVVKAGDWFAAEVPTKNSYTLVGCTVSPGFDFRDFEMPEKRKLISLYPEHEEVLAKLGYQKK